MDPPKPVMENQSIEDMSPDANARKENSRKSKKDKVKKNAKKSKAKQEDGGPGTAMSNLADLPSLGGPAPALGGRFGNGFGQEKPEEDSNDGFDDFNMNEDVIGDSSNKLDNAEKYLQDYYRE